jgi:hypothetical protein
MKPETATIVRADLLRLWAAAPEPGALLDARGAFERQIGAVI